MALHRCSGQTLIALLAAFLATASCRNGAEPDIREQIARFGARRFVLQSIAGEAMPALAADNGYSRVTLLADTVWLRDDGTGLRRAWGRAVDVSEPGVQRPYMHEAQLAYRVTGTRIEIDFACPGLALCVAPPHFIGTVEEGRLRIGDALYYRTPLVYVETKD